MGQCPLAEGAPAGTRGNEETFTATVTFDTKDLFGKFDAIREIKLKNPQEKKDEDKAKK
jgi:hypothetical protein